LFGVYRHVQKFHNHIVTTRFNGGRTRGQFMWIDWWNPCHRYNFWKP